MLLAISLGLLGTVLVYLLVFLIAWYIVSIVPLPPPIAGARWIGYVILCIIAIVVLLSLIGVSL